MKISLIVAMSRNRVIGIDGRMPWHLPADLRYFRRVTLGCPVLMGRKTCEAIGRPLPGRRNIVISRNPGFRPEGCEVFPGLDAGLAACAGAAEVFVIGGGSLYRELLDRADFLYLTEIDREFVGDTYFPVIDYRQWRELARQEVIDDPDVDFKYTFLKYQRF